MAGNQFLKTGSTTTTVSSGGSVAAGAAAAANGAGNLINSTNLDWTVTARLSCTAGSAPAQGAAVQLYLVPIADGSAVATVDTATPYLSPNYLVGQFLWPAPSGSVSGIKLDIDGIALSALDYAPYLVNQLGQSISSGWSLVFYGTRGQYS